MASTTSPSCSTPTSLSQFWNYDVYLSFRGEDTRKNFTDHLCTALHQRDILAFKDDETLLYSETIGACLLKAIEESRIVIIIFSKNYGISPWCLDELVYIMRCRDQRGQTVIPIFYHVDPSDVRKQKGKFGEAFARHVMNNTKVETWRKALVNVSDISGWKINNNPDSRESICIKQVVDMISNKLYPSEDLIETGTRLQDPKSRGGDWLYNHFRKSNISVSSSNLSSRPSYYTPASSSKLRNHDVFVSFRGEDTRYNFVDHLYSALDQREILTYKEEETPPLGEFIESSHFKAIEGSQIVIIIFSQGYARSSWCLDELAYIMQCRIERGKIVMPIFYDVDPSNVQKQRGCYAEAFVGHELKNKNKVESWRKALEDASNLFGLQIKDIASGYESKGIKLIVDSISKRLFPDKGLIGQRTRLEYLKYRGSGMTTLAASHGEMEHLKIRRQDILLATNNFAESEIIAKGGGFGKVYRGQSEQHGVIAVKRLDRKLGQGDREFMMEIALLSICKHENIVSLVGYCDQDDDKILVYKFESNGSLDKHLPNKDITWIQRLQICLDAANGLKYLHDDVQHQHRIVHRDVKSSNILLDENWKAKISDFGLSKIALANVGSVIFSGVCGTPGYVDPLYLNHDKVTQKSDVYSFGVVLFEVLFGRLVFDSLEYPDERYFSVKLAQDHYENGTLDEIINSDLRSQMKSDSLSTYSTIAYRCLKKRREDRPTMSLVVDQLEKALELQQESTGFWHDVYICFRDRDTACHIVDDLLDCLLREGVSTSMDIVTQSRKESTLIKAIERSRCFVIVFTKKFAVNSWYLDEVAKITECMKDKRQFILPVFYNVSRSDVQTQKGYFGEVISEYDTHPRIEIWRNALLEATNVAGLEYSSFRCTGDLVKKAVEEIKSGLSESR